MRSVSRKTRLLLLLALAACATASLIAVEKGKSKSTAAGRMEEEKRALHALNRLTFGPRPGEVEKVQAMGVDKWIEQQVNPSKGDDSALEARLAPLRTLQMSTREMMENYPPPQVIRAIAEGRLPLPSDPQRRAVYEAQIERYKARREQQQKEAASGNNNANAPGDDARGGEDDMKEMNPEERAQRREARMYAELKAEELLDMTPEQRTAEIMKMSNDERRALARGFSPEEREKVFSEFTPEQREAVLALINPQAVVVGEVQQTKVLRAAYSGRQLEEVMTDFWFNHFNVFINKGPDRYLVTAYERDVIRPNAMGRFKDLLFATAKSPAMLFYLDNWQSVGPNSEFAKNGPERRGDQQSGQRRNRRMNQQYPGYGRGQTGRNRYPGMGQPYPPYRTGMPPAGNQDQMARRRQQQQQQQNRRSGLNENYARELMELHTLGVNGGYTQKDVTEVARVFTGWTIKQPRQGGGFEYEGRMHEPGDKVVLGQTIEQGGEGEGKKVLEMLARHPSTAKFVSTKLAQRFVSDNPPPALVERMAQTFLKSDGDIREVLRTLFKSPEFWGSEAYRAKVKTPLEFVASAVRATGVDVQNAMPLVQALNRMGMPPYGMQPPTGYSMKAEAWVNSNALLNRMNFALALGGGRMPGVKFDPQTVLHGAPPPEKSDTALALLEDALLSGDLSKQTHDTIKKQLDDPQVTGRLLDDPQRVPNLGVIAGLILGSPEFQRR
ncbi:MAG: DUF1800 family protein [Terriglobales bacterium]